MRALFLAIVFAASGCSLIFNGSDLHGKGGDGGGGSGGGDDMAAGDGGGGDDLAPPTGDLGPLATVSFAKTASSPISVGDAPYSITVGDFDGDGKLDIATANDNGNNVTVLFGDGTGGFVSVNVTPSGVNAACAPYAISSANFDGQGPTDIVVTCTDLANINGGVVMLGSASRSFTQKPITGLINNTGNIKPEAVVGGDFNHDGKLDLAVAYAGTDSVAIFIGNGDGTFATSATTHTLTTGAQPRSLAAADLNNDGRDDLVVGDNGLSTLTVFVQSTGNALPTAGTVYNVGGGPADIAIADVNGDTVPDLIVPNENDSTISVLIGKGDGTFPAGAGSNTPPSYNPGANALSIAVADFNRDGKIDLVSGAGVQNTTSVMLGDGMGGFGSTQHPDCGAISSSVVTGRFNADSLPDIACTNNSTSNSGVTVLLNTSH